MCGCDTKTQCAGGWLCRPYWRVCRSTIQVCQPKKEFVNVSFSGVLLKRAVNKFLNALFSGVSLMTWPQQLSLTGMGITSTSRRTGTYTRKLLITAGEWNSPSFKAWRWSSHSRHNYLRRGGCCSLNFQTNFPSFSNPPILYFSLTNPPIHLRSPLFAPGERLPTKLRRSSRHHQLPCSRLLQVRLGQLASVEQFLKKTSSDENMICREYKINQEDNAAGIPGILIGAKNTPSTNIRTKNLFYRSLSKWQLCRGKSMAGAEAQKP